MKDKLIPCFMEDLSENEVMYLTKDLLIEANNAAIRENRNRKLPEEYLETLPNDKPYIVQKAFLHKKDEMRLTIAIDKYNSDFLDMSILRYKSLPIGRISEDNCVIPEDPSITALKRPYVDGREWQETTVRKPIRKQYNFRKEVLRAYSNQCAVCSVNNPKILRAAHIIPVVNSSDDTINNGICLCINHEVSFDNNILRISPNGDVILSDSSTIKVEFNKIRFPKNKADYPSTENLAKRFFSFNIEE